MSNFNSSAQNKIVDEMVDAWNDAYEAEYFTDGTIKDNRATAMRAALAIAEPIISAQARAKALEEAAAVLNQAADEANSECNNAHYETDTGAWVCTRRCGCDCEAIQDQADKHRKAILALKDRPHD